LYYDFALLSNKLLQIVTNSTENDRLVYDYNNKESTNKDIVMLSLSKSNIDDNIYNVLSSLITKTIALLYYCSLL